MRRRLILNSLSVVCVFIISFYGRDIFNSFVTINFSETFTKVLYVYSWWALPTTLLVGILYGFKNIPSNLGLNKGVFIALLLTIVTILPMMISSAVAGEIDNNLSIKTLVYKTLFAGFFEEYLFRGFLFGILFRKLKWGFVPAAILGAAIFGLAHVYQSSAFIETISVFLITAMGSIWFSWLYIEWNNNLWVPIFLHITMNLSWILFDVSSNAIGGLYTNIFRVFTIALSILITIRYHKTRDLTINKANLFTNLQEIK